MIKKKLSGQTIAIIILAVMLLLTIGFGGVYAFYSARSNKVTGTIVMANLKIRLSQEDGSANTGKTDVVISYGSNVVPGEKLYNSALKVLNESSVNVYLVVAYSLGAVVKDPDTQIETPIEDKYVKPVLGLGYQYVNDANEYTQTSVSTSTSGWVDYVFDASSVPNGEDKIYRCLVLTAPLEKETSIDVIGEESLSLHFSMGNEYQRSTISLTFQAFAIGAASFDFASGASKADKCREIVKAVYASQDCKFLYGIATSV